MFVVVAVAAAIGVGLSLTVMGADFIRNPDNSLWEQILAAPSLPFRPDAVATGLLNAGVAAASVITHARSTTQH